MTSGLMSESQPALGLDLFAEELAMNAIVWGPYEEGIILPASSFGTFTSASSASCPGPFATLGTLSTLSSASGGNR